MPFSAIKCANPAVRGYPERSAVTRCCGEPGSASVREAGEFERIIAAFARSPNDGLVVTQTAQLVINLKTARAVRA
jgi:hypothetical protein